MVPSVCTQNTDNVNSVNSLNLKGVKITHQKKKKKSNNPKQLIALTKRERIN